MQRIQWRDSLAQRDSCRTMDWRNYFPIDFLASWVAQDLHEHYQMSRLEPYGSDSRGRLLCTQKSCNICSLQRHWDWIPSVCHFLSSLVHKNSAKWVWLSNFAQKILQFQDGHVFPDVISPIQSFVCNVWTNIYHSSVYQQISLVTWLSP